VPAAGRPDQYEYEIDIRPDDRFTTDAPCDRKPVAAARRIWKRWVVPVGPPASQAARPFIS